MQVYIYEIYKYYANAAHVNAKRKHAMDVITTNRFVFPLVFAAGIAFAVIGTLLSRYIRGLSIDAAGERRFSHRCSATNDIDYLLITL